MSGITDLSELLKTMRPELQEGEYVSCTVPDNQAIDIKDILGSFREEEGITLILSGRQPTDCNYHILILPPGSP